MLQPWRLENTELSMEAMQEQIEAVELFVVGLRQSDMEERKVLAALKQSVIIVLSASVRMLGQAASIEASQPPRVFIASDGRRVEV